MPPVHFLFFAVILLTMTFNSSNAIQCYSCSSRENPDCVDITSSDNSTLIECSQPDAFCRKTQQTLTDSGLTIITRACGWIKFDKYPGDYCMSANTNFIKAMECQCMTDMCNGGSSLKAVGVLSLIAFVFTILTNFD